MAATIHFELVTPERSVVHQDVEYIGAPGVNGEFGVLPNHVPFLSALGIGSLYFKVEGQRFYVFVAGGFAEITPEKMTVLAETAEKAEEIDIERAKKARERAEMRLRQAADRLEHARARAALMRAMQRVSTREAAYE
jgi:F-type H+-transporting ATPase subunit epsilon